MDSAQLAAVQEKLPTGYTADTWIVPGEGEVFRVTRTEGRNSKYCMCRSDENLDDPERVLLPMLRNLQGAFLFDFYGDNSIAIHKELALAAQRGIKAVPEFRGLLEAMERNERELDSLIPAEQRRSYTEFLDLIELVN